MQKKKNVVELGQVQSMKIRQSDTQLNESSASNNVVDARRGSTRFGCVGAAGGGERNLKVWQRRKHRPSRAAVTVVACPFSQDTIIFSQAGAFGFLEHGASAAAA
jgi:hypothetical protein